MNFNLTAKVSHPASVEEITNLRSGRRDFLRKMLSWAALAWLPLGRARAQPGKLTLDEVNRMDLGAFVAAFGDVIEFTPAAAKGAFTKRPFATVTALGRAGRGGRPALVIAFSTYGNAHDHHFFRNRRQMIAGAVPPPRIDLANRDLVPAHLRSVWLALVGLGLKSSIAELLDLGAPGFALRPEYADTAASTAHRLTEILDALRIVTRSAEPEISRAPWYSEAWIKEVARGAPEAFDRAFDRWRDLYRAACEQRDAARRIIDDPGTRDRRQKEAAEQREREARSEIELLLNSSNRTEADFYTYRYLANKGFIPGYNFPRLPVRALTRRRHGSARCRKGSSTSWASRSDECTRGRRAKPAWLCDPERRASSAWSRRSMR
jgi:hypothetical protein